MSTFAIRHKFISFAFQMAVIKVPIQEFLQLAQSHPVLDVRSPGEYQHAHIPDAVSFPLFSDEERKEVGTAYKQVSREEAIKIGLDFFGPKMRSMVEQAEKIGGNWQKPVGNWQLAVGKGEKLNWQLAGGKGEEENTDTQHEEFANSQLPTANSLANSQLPTANSFVNSILVHCWRGGMRSAAIAWLLDLYGFKVYQLDGGYKAFRNWTLEQVRKDYAFRIIGGYTGSGKTFVLQELSKRGKSAIDLEGIAKHKGSAFGGLDRIPQPSSEMFENILASQLFRLTEKEAANEIWIEDESQRIGNLNMPYELWQVFRTKPLYFLDIPFEERLNNIVQEYGAHPKEALINAIVRIQKRLGGLETKTAVNCLIENDIKGCFDILLKYYDKHYTKALNLRPDLKEVMIKIEADKVDAKVNAIKILNLEHESGTGK